MPLTTINTITPTEAADDIQRFQNVDAYQDYFQFNGPKAFTMSLQELVNAANSLSSLKEQYGIDGVRFYMGQRKQWSKLGDSDGFSEILINSLIFVPVVGYGGLEVEIIPIDGTPQKVLLSFPTQAGVDLPSVSIPSGTGAAPTEVNLCYDFTYPCPSTCPNPADSVLSNATPQP
jgi:hypothetical protein